MEYPTTTAKPTAGEEAIKPQKSSGFKKAMHYIFVHNIGLKIAAIVVAVALFVLKAGLS